MQEYEKWYEQIYTTYRIKSKNEDEKKRKFARNVLHTRLDSVSIEISWAFDAEINLEKFQNFNYFLFFFRDAHWTVFVSLHMQHYDVQQYKRWFLIHDFVLQTDKTWVISNDFRKVT